MELRLKKLREDQDRAKQRIRKNEMALEEAMRVKERKRQDNDAKTKFVMDMIKAEQDARVWTNNFR